MPEKAGNGRQLGESLALGFRWGCRKKGRGLVYALSLRGGGPSCSAFCSAHCSARAVPTAPGERPHCSRWYPATPSGSPCAGQLGHPSSPAPPPGRPHCQGWLPPQVEGVGGWAAGRIPWGKAPVRIEFGKFNFASDFYDCRFYLRRPPTKIYNVLFVSAVFDFFAGV